MTTVRIEHGVKNFDQWKTAFDRFDDLRAEHKVRRFTVSRPVDDERYVIIDLDFDSQPAANAFLTTMDGVWKSALSATVHDGPTRARITEAVEAREL